ncbi:DUF1634 domain-containing protein [Paradesulfitobacterium ferrireducens]|uniref:DUF1634 domain-containing protein n=1 Tax=Paradesulfitobacterium ferrireducens TaxID=2816476 RepID=UPI001A8F5AE1|nr:DUF1634 domain-containing protein [Paradesulfitobacterium ferrireducens]
MSEKDLFDTERFISLSLRLGVYLSGFFIALGLVLYILFGSGYPAGSFPHSVSTVWQGLIELKPDAIISLGLFLLIATPIFRVGASTILFLKEKDYLYALLTLFVFCILILSLALGKEL